MLEDQENRISQYRLLLEMRGLQLARHVAKVVMPIASSDFLDFFESQCDRMAPDQIAECMTVVRQIKVPQAACILARHLEHSHFHAACYAAQGLADFDVVPDNVVQSVLDVLLHGETAFGGELLAVLRKAKSHSARALVEAHAPALASKYGDMARNLKFESTKT